MQRMNALAESLRASMPENDDARPFRASTGVSPAQARRGAPVPSPSRSGGNIRRGASGVLTSGAGSSDVAQKAADYEEVSVHVAYPPDPVRSHTPAVRIDTSAVRGDVA